MAPLEAHAGLFSMFGTEAQAQYNVNIEPKNSQTMDLLEANVSSASLIKKEATSKTTATKNADPEINTNATVSIVSDTALEPASTPVSPAGGEPALGIGSSDFAFDEISVYVVRSGDTVSSIANMFGVTPDTVLSANELPKGAKLKEGEVLLILPYSGVEHTVAKGQTLQGIANLYKVDVEDIIIFNDLENGSKLAIGEKLMIPGGSLQGTGSTSTSSGSKPGSSGGVPKPYPQTGKDVAGYFVNPVPNARKSRGINATHRGVDLAAPTGTPIYAAAAGRVTFARNGYNGGFGNLVIVAHPNGTETLYAHMSKIATTVGAQVSQKEIIGYVGSTGRSTGPHLHVEVHGAKNPF